MEHSGGCRSWIAIAEIKTSRIDRNQQGRRGEHIEFRLQEIDVVAVGAVERPTDRHGMQVDSDSPLLAEFRPVSWVPLGALTGAGSVVRPAIDRHVSQIETALVEAARASVWI